VPAGENQGEAGRRLQRVFEIVVAKVNGLVVWILAGEQVFNVTKDARQETPFGAGVHGSEHV
jgi:hypothetical protein